MIFWLWLFLKTQSTPILNVSRFSFCTKLITTFYSNSTEVSQYNMEDETERKAIILKKLEKETLPHFLTKLDESAKENNGHLVLGKLTWADIYFVGLLDYCNGVLHRDVIKDFINLCTVRENVINIPSIKEWIDNRPDSDY